MCCDQFLFSSFFSFQTSLASLMTTLGQSHPYFVRCVKPNEKKVCPAVIAFFSLTSWLKVWMGAPRWVRKWPLWLLLLWEKMICLVTRVRKWNFVPCYCIDLDSISTLHFSYRGRISSVGKALDCRAEDRGFDSRGRTITQGLKIVEKVLAGARHSRGSDDHVKWRSLET